MGRPARRTRRWFAAAAAALALALQPGAPSLPVVGGASPAAAAEVGPPCPTGYAKTVLAATDFESGVPARWINHGMTVEARGDATSGGKVLASRMDGTAWQHDLGTAPGLTLPARSRLFASFAVRGTFATSTASYGMVMTDRPSSGGTALSARTVAQHTDWQVVTFEWGSNEAERTIPTRSLAIYHRDLALSTTESMELDDVTVYACTAAAIPATGVRGDIDGDRRADVVELSSEGTLRSPRSPWPLARGLGDVTWVGYPGDVNGDGHTDLVIRRGDGRLQLLAGTAELRFADPVTIGTGWQGMTALVATGDTTGDGLSDVYARTPSGDLLRYTISADGRSMWGGWRVGTGWSMFTHIVSVGDATGDGRPDLAGVTPAGDLRLYPTVAGAPTGTGRTIGTSWFFPWVHNEGDLDGDGHDDLVVPDSMGNLYYYRTNGAGGWLGRYAVSTLSGLSGATNTATNAALTSAAPSGSSAPAAASASGTTEKIGVGGLAPAPGQDCPTGTSRLSTVVGLDFESGLTDAADAGWTLRTAPDAAQGTHTAITSGYVSFGLGWSLIWPPGNRTYLRFRVRGLGGELVTLKLGWQTVTLPRSTALRETEWRDVVADVTAQVAGGLTRRVGVGGAAPSPRSTTSGCISARPRPVGSAETSTATAAPTTWPATSPMTTGSTWCSAGARARSPPR